MLGHRAAAPNASAVKSNQRFSASVWAAKGNYSVLRLTLQSVGSAAYDEHRSAINMANVMR
eukprot:12663851-Heterocapsa_arctica.AAC.1